MWAGGRLSETVRRVGRQETMSETEGRAGRQETVRETEGRVGGRETVSETKGRVGGRETVSETEGRVGGRVTVSETDGRVGGRETVSETKGRVGGREAVATHRLMSASQPQRARRPHAAQPADTETRGPCCTPGHPTVCLSLTCMRYPRHPVQLRLSETEREENFKKAQDEHL